MTPTTLFVGLKVNSEFAPVSLTLFPKSPSYKLGQHGSRAVKRGFNKLEKCAHCLSNCWHLFFITDSFSFALPGEDNEYTEVSA